MHLVSKIMWALLPQGYRSAVKLTSYTLIMLDSMLVLESRYMYTEYQARLWVLVCSQVLLPQSLELHLQILTNSTRTLCYKSMLMRSNIHVLIADGT